MTQESLFDSPIEEPQKPSGPVTCLGMAFENDEARRAHFTEELRKKLQDPEFRKIEGFPGGSDEDILNLSEPPYYTACPNPWIGEFIKCYGSQYEPEVKYSRDPLAIDISVGKSDPIYKAHSYHTKVPHLAIVPSILHYTEPGDVVLDGFAGSGMTGVAAQWCAFAPESYWQELQNEWEKQDRALPKKGARRVILNDLSPAATFIAANYNLPVDIGKFCSVVELILDDLQKELGWMYYTTYEGRLGEISFTVWSEVFTCPECAGEVVFHDHALNESGRVKDDFNCPHCGAVLSKKNLELVFETVLDKAINKTKKKPKRKPVLIKFKSGTKSYTKPVEMSDLEIIKKIEGMPFPDNVPIKEFPDMQMMRVGRMKTTNVIHVHDMFLPRTIHVLSRFFEKANEVQDESIKRTLRIIVQHQFVNASIMNRYRPASSFGNSPLTGVFYVSSLVAEANVFALLRGSINRIKRMGKTSWGQDEDWGKEVIISTSSSTSLDNISENTIDYIFTDPPFGENIYYSDLNYLVESWYGVISDSAPEAIIDRVKQKSVFDYQHLMKRSFEEYFRVLKPGRWMTVVFSNSRAAVWNAIQLALQQVGFVVAEVSTLDKVHHSFQQVVSPNAVKQDLVISAYKPNGGLEERFQKSGGTIESAWDFVKTHLKQLSVTKLINGGLEFILERDPRRIYDRLVAWFVRHDTPVPLSSNEFLEGLRQRFPERDGMVFLADQVAEYDKMRVQFDQGPQFDLFVSDEASAINWLRQLLRGKPQISSDINPQFMQQLGGWSKNEAQLDLRELLNQNFLSYDGNGPVPDQIHTYLSSNWKELRKLSKDAPALVAKAQDRWYVPDPNKAGDLEKLREKALLKEFEEYKQAKKKLKVFRIEAVRTGFKKAWQERDYATIISVAEKTPNKILEEDPKLLMWYDQAVTRMGGNSA